MASVEVPNALYVECPLNNYFLEQLKNCGFSAVDTSQLSVRFGQTIAASFPKG